MLEQDISIIVDLNFDNLLYYKVEDIFISKSDVEGNQKDKKENRLNFLLLFY